MTHSQSPSSLFQGVTPTSSKPSELNAFPFHINTLDLFYPQSFYPFRKYFLTLGVLALLLTPKSWAGVFFLPHYITENQRALGIQPQWLLSQGATLGVELRYGQGVSELVNLGALIGTESGQSPFKVGGSATFDFYPNTAEQPGLGLAIQGIFTKTKTEGMWSLSAAPYFHKTLAIPGMIPVEPFIALPLEQRIFNSKSTSPFQMSFIVGTFFHYGEHWSSVLELGIGITQVMAIFSGGLIYYY